MKIMGFMIGGCLLLTFNLKAIIIFRHFFMGAMEEAYTGSADMELNFM